MKDTKRQIRGWFPLLCALVVPLVISCTLPGAGCLTSLDQDTLDRLVFSLQPSLQMGPGESAQLQLGTAECCTFFEPVDACVAWSIQPEEGAALTRQGRLSIDASTPHGAVFVVAADVENGRRLLSTEVHVFDPARNPLVGNWHEVAQIDCATGQEVPVEDAIEELRFFADGRASVTWVPFESWVDYWSRYRISAGGELSLSVEGDDFSHGDVDLEGRFVIDEGGDLLLQEMWLGSHFEDGGPANCGHRFTR